MFMASLFAVLIAATEEAEVCAVIHFGTAFGANLLSFHFFPMRK